jgi:hypothetical protein
MDRANNFHDLTRKYIKKESWWLLKK